MGGPGYRPFIAFAVVIALLAVVPSARAESAPPTPASEDPAPVPTAAPFSMNVRVNSGGTGYNFQVEPTMVINSAGRVFVGWKEALTHNGGGQRVAFSYSANGGMTWAPNVLMPLVTLPHQSDPWLTVTPTDRVYFTRIEYADTSSSGGIAVTNTTDGVIWGTTSFYDDAPNFADKESAAHDGAGNLYWVWNTDSATGQDLAFARSNDGGATWTSKVLVNTVPGPLGGIVQVAPSGVVLAAWWSYGSDNILFDRSFDGGRTWGPDIRVNDIPGSAASPLGSDPPVLPAMAVAADGTIYVSWEDYRNARPGGVANGNMDIMVSRSVDGGTTWSPALKVNDDATTARQWMSDLALDPFGGVHVAWMDDRLGQHNVYYANSTNGGVTFGPNVRVSTVGTALSYNRPGDYLAMESAPNGTIDIVWTDGRGADLDIYFATLAPPTDYLLDTVPTGLMDLLDGSPFTAPHRFACAPGSMHQIGTMSPQGAGATRYTFDHWSDGGAITHAITCGVTHAFTAFFTTEHRVTVTTSPPSLNLIVDGATVGAPWTNWWVAGSTHTIEAPSPQTQGTTRDVYASWSDGGAQSHAIRASSPSTYTANFLMEHQVTVTTSPPNLNVTVDGVDAIAPQAFWWGRGSVHGIGTTSPQFVGATRYPFAQWSDGGAQNHSVVVNGSATITAGFGTQYLITLNTQPQGFPVRVDGTLYQAPYAYWCDAGATSTIAALDPTMPPETRVTFQLWSDAGAQTHMVSCNGPATYTATYLVEYTIFLSTSPAALEVRTDGVPSSGFWCEQGSQHTIGAPSPQGAGGTRYLFGSWSDGGAQDHTVPCTGSATYTAAFATQYAITIGTSPPGLTVSVDGVPISAAQTYWWDEESTHPVDLATPQGSGTTRYRFSSWSDGEAKAHDVAANGPATITAVFGTQYRLDVLTPHGTAACGVAECWYDAHATATFSVTPGTVPGATGTRYVFIAWSQDSTATTASATIAMEGPRAVAALWQTQYELTIVSAYGTPTGAGWHAEGTAVSASVEDTVAAGGTTYRFTGWTGDASATTASITVTMDAPKTITATWAAAPPNTPSAGLLAWLLPLVAIVAVILFLVFFLWRRRKKEDEEPEAPPPP